MIMTTKARSASPEKRLLEVNLQANKCKSASPLKRQGTEILDNVSIKVPEKVRCCKNSQNETKIR